MGTRTCGNSWGLVQQGSLAPGMLPELADSTESRDMTQGFLRVLTALSSPAALRLGVMHALCRMSARDQYTAYAFLQVSV